MQVDEVAHRRQMGAVLGQCCHDGGLQCCRTVAVEQFEQPTRQDTQMRTALGSQQEQRFRAGGGVVQAILGAVLAGRVLVLLQCKRSMNRSVAAAA